MRGIRHTCFHIFSPDPGAVYRINYMELHVKYIEDYIKTI